MAVESDQAHASHGPSNLDQQAVDDFLVSFDAFAQAVRRARGAQAQSREETLTLSQYALLQALSSRESARVRELAAEAGITPSTATRILDALERRAIVSRSRANDDRRGVTVRLTDLGREQLNDQDGWLRGRQRAFFEGLPEMERELAPDLLIRLAALIDGSPPAPADHPPAPADHPIPRSTENQPMTPRLSGLQGDHVARALGVPQLSLM